jgi:CRP-like cAMP-binding protein
MRPDELATHEQLEMFHHPERYADEPDLAQPTTVTPVEACAATRERLGNLVDANPPRVTLTAAVRS